MSPWKRVWLFIWTNLNSFTQECFVLSLVEIGAAVFLNFAQVFLLFRNYLPLEKGWPFIWINLNFFHRRYFVPSLVIVGQVVLKIASMHFCYFVIICPRKGCDPHLNKLESTSLRDALCQVLLKLAQTDGQTDEQGAIRKAHLSFQLRWAKKRVTNVTRNAQVLLVNMVYWVIEILQFFFLVIHQGRLFGLVVAYFQ